MYAGILPVRLARAKLRLAGNNLSAGRFWEACTAGM